MTKMALMRTRRQSVAPGKPETNPAAVYLASLAPSGRRTMAARLTSAAQLMGVTREPSTGHLSASDRSRRCAPDS
jgi:hypothetical protein